MVCCHTIYTIDGLLSHRTVDGLASIPLTVCFHTIDGLLSYRRRSTPTSFSHRLSRNAVIQQCLTGSLEGGETSIHASISYFLSRCTHGRWMKDSKYSFFMRCALCGTSRPAAHVFDAGAHVCVPVAIVHVLVEYILLHHC